MSQGSKKKKGIALALVLLLVMSALAVVVFGKGYIRNKNRGRSPHVISASSAEQIAERIISESLPSTADAAIFFSTSLLTLNTAISSADNADELLYTAEFSIIATGAP